MRDLRKVVITGLGAVSAYGLGADPLWRGLLAGRSCVAPASPTLEDLPAIPAFPASAIGAFSARDVLGKGLRGVCRESQLLLAATLFARRDAGLADGAVARDAEGVFAGTRWAGLEDYLHFHLERSIWGPEKVSPTRGPNTGFNAPASHVSIRHDLQGPNLTFASRSSASLDAIGHAADWIRKQRVKIVYAGGIESLSYPRARHLLAAGRPIAEAARPFDARRTGATPGEGAVIVVLEDAEHARARGARILAEVGAWAMAFEPAQPDRAARRVLRAAGPADAIFGSASGDRALDAWEAAAIAADHADVPVCAVKGAAGEWEGASGALQVLAATRALADRVVPPTAGFERLDPELPAIRVAGAARPGALASVAVVTLHGSGRASALALRAAP